MGDSEMAFTAQANHLPRCLLDVREITCTSQQKAKHEMPRLESNLPSDQHKNITTCVVSTMGTMIVELC
jgi:hypothetical protein